MGGPTVKQCACGRSYSQAEWDQLRLVGRQRFEWGEYQELRNCVCGSTMTLQLEKGFPPIPNATYLDQDCVEANVQGYPVHFYKGATAWRVCVLGEKGSTGSAGVSPLITPHVFTCPEEACAWLIDWLRGDRKWDRSWGPAPVWPVPAPFFRSRIRTRPS